MRMGRRNFYKSLITKDPTTNTKPSEGKKAIDSPELIIDIIDDMKRLENSVRNWNMEDAIKWALGLDLYVRDKTNQLNPPLYSKFSRHSFVKERGRIVSVDLFGHFDTEFTYNHPAIVLGGGTDWIVIAPISSPSYGDGIQTHVDLTASQTHGGMRNNCAVKLESIRSISKKRILDWHGKVSDGSKLDEIDEKIMEMILPHSHQTFNSLKVDLKKSEDELEELKNELQDAGNQISDLQKELIDTYDKLIKTLEGDAQEEIVIKRDLLIQQPGSLQK